MIERELALEIKERALVVVQELGSIVSDFKGRLSADDLEIVMRGVGLSIGTIATELLEPIFAQHPELDDLK